MYASWGKFPPFSRHSFSIEYQSSMFSIGGDCEFAELSLFYSDVPVTVDAAAAKILWPVCVGIVNDEECEASVFVKAWDPYVSRNVFSLLHLGAHHLREVWHLEESYVRRAQKL